MKNTEKAVMGESEASRVEVRDSTGNVLRPGMYGYETALARRDCEHLAKQRASDKVKAVTPTTSGQADSRTVASEKEFNVLSETGAVMHVMATCTEDAINIAQSVGLRVAKCSEVETES